MFKGVALLVVVSVCVCSGTDVCPGIMGSGYVAEVTGAVFVFSLVVLRAVVVVVMVLKVV